MKRIGLLIAFTLLLGSQTNAFEGRVSFGAFYEALQPYGEWVTTADLGYCWRPYDIDNNWRPYTNGRWAWTDDGWFWVSYENWGWAPYHYGRWAYESVYGWVWVPDYEWGPAWVQWRISDGYIGWAPLPPRAGWHVSIGFDAGDFGIPYFAWCFTAGNGFYSDHPMLIHAGRNRHLLGMTRNVTNISIGDRRVINRGPDYRTVERMGRTRINPVRIVDERTTDNMRGSRIEGDRVRVYRPEVRPDTRTELDNRARAGVVRERPGQSTRGGRAVEPQGNRGAVEGTRQTQPQPEPRVGRQQDGNRPDRMNTRPDEGTINTQPNRSSEEMQNFHSQPNNQPRFNIPQRKEEPRREVAPSRPADQNRQPQIDRRRTESRPQMERRSSGGSGENRDGQNGRRR